MMTVLGWLTPNVWLTGAIVGLLTLVVAWDHGRMQRQVEKGVSVERQRTEKANGIVTKQMGAAARGTVDRGVRGQRDPNAVDE